MTVKRKTIVMALSLASLFSGCAITSSGSLLNLQPRVLHGVKLEATGFNKEYRYLDFKYLLRGKQIGGFSRGLVTDPSFSGAIDAGESHYRVGDSLYLRWKHLPSGVIYEKTVNFRNLLPSPVQERGGFYLAVDRDVLNIYLASDWKKGLTPCSEKQNISNKNPTPDNRAAAYHCGSLLWKIYPEQKQLNMVIKND